MTTTAWLTLALIVAMICGTVIFLAVLFATLVDSRWNDDKTE